MNYLWHNGNENDWQKALNRYWEFVNPRNLEIEKEMDVLDSNQVKAMNDSEWYDFLLNGYFRWKFTAPNICAANAKNLNEYVARVGIAGLYAIKEQIFSFDLADIGRGLNIACSIGGLGPAGASGLLAVLFPKYFATIDQFAVTALRKVNNLPENTSISKMKENNLKISDGVVLIGLMRRKAEELNAKFGTDFWTPRKIDMVLWGFRD